MKQVTAIIIGAGARGSGYAQFGLDFPDRLKVVGVADPRDFYRNRLRDEHKIPEKYVVKDWAELAGMNKFADCAVIATPDRLHKDPAVACAKKGYHILLEKPMAVTYKDCLEIVTSCKENGCMLAVAHVLRYAPQAMKIKELIDSGVIGDVANIQLLEPVGFWHFAHSFVRGSWRNEGESTFSLLAKSCHDIDLITYWMGQRKCKLVTSFGSLRHFRKEEKVGFWHFAHSYVRGNWRNEQESSFSLLAKSCHDLDLIQFWMGNRKCLQVSSFGSLKHFRKDQKPEGAGERCTDCSIEEKCPYSSKKIYIDAYKSGVRRFPVNRVADPPDIESLTEFLKTGPYGRCVYDCDNDVMDNQVVNMQYEDGATVSFSMVAFTEKVCERQIRVFGPLGEITCDMAEMRVRHVDFKDGQGYTHNLTFSEDAMSSNLKSHGKADFYAMDAFVKAVATNDPSKVMTGPDESLHSHLICFLAERARKENKVVNVQNENGDNL